MGHIGQGADLTAPDFAALDRAQGVAILPTGAIEQHGPHLPLSVDRDPTLAVLTRALPLIDPVLTVLALPVQAIVRTELAEDFGSSHLHLQEVHPALGLGAAPLRPGWLLGDLNPKGAIGNAAAATAEKDEALLTNAARNLARVVAVFARFG
ncbi:MAG: creatininase family protein [Tabrizicola sp.]|uniref:creatininase family protein n=1 Tax=Tabrizicola sp. TaxID=2005166 RepID=UPI002AB9040F|nr:creatininase family protein [Tabrizicola sp.]MDZ4086435.1 creatininase family protein [Tabrizicola sp.]